VSTQRRLIAAAGFSAVVFGIAVFLPWVAAADGADQVAGWGSGYYPQFRGMLVIACAAVAVACLAAAWSAAPAHDGRGALAAVVVVAVVAIVATASVIAGPAAFIGTAQTSGVRPGAVVALIAEVATGLAAAAAAAAQGVPDGATFIA
jgi:hypothetical protein